MFEESLLKERDQSKQKQTKKNAETKQEAKKKKKKDFQENPLELIASER